MRFVLCSPTLTIVLVLLGISGALAAEELYINFERFPDGVPIPSATQLNNQFLSMGVLFQPHPGSPWSAIVFEEGTNGTDHFGNSPTNIVAIGGFGETTRIRFVDPYDATQRVVRQVSVLAGDGDPWTESVEFAAYDRFGGLLHSEIQTELSRGYLFRYDAPAWTVAYVELTLLDSGESGACFDDLRYDRPIALGTTPGDVAGVVVKRFDPETGGLTVAWEPTCAAAGHTIQYGLLQDVGTYGYQGQVCGIGNDGEYDEFDPGLESYFFLIVGDDGVHEGPYGTDSSGVPRPRYVSAPQCPFLDGASRCDVEPPVD